MRLVSPIGGALSGSGNLSNVARLAASKICASFQRQLRWDNNDPVYCTTIIVMKVILFSMNLQFD
jgi:hypothetical protein